MMIVVLVANLSQVRMEVVVEMIVVVVLLAAKNACNIWDEQSKHGHTSPSTEQCTHILPLYSRNSRFIYIPRIYISKIFPQIQSKDIQLKYAHKVKKL